MPKGIGRAERRAYLLGNVDDTQRRSLLFVPGVAPQRFAKACASGPDTVLFDLEDSVPVDAKDVARDHVCRALCEMDFRECEPAVRVNGAGTPWHEDDLRAVAKAGAKAIMIPKAESAGTILSAVALLEAEESPARLLALVETPRGVARALEVGESAERVDAMCFGHADFALEMGVSAADPSRGVLYHARCSVAVAARACGVQPIDNVCLAVRDDQAFREDVEVGVDLGFEGKMCIHPAQVAAANEMHTPSPEQVSYAQRVLSGWQTARASGLAVFTLENKMVDAPLVAAQARVLARARRAGIIPPEVP